MKNRKILTAIIAASVFVALGSALADQSSVTATTNTWNNVGIVNDGGNVVGIIGSGGITANVTGEGPNFAGDVQAGISQDAGQTVVLPHGTMIDMTHQAGGGVYIEMNGHAPVDPSTSTGVRMESANVGGANFAIMPDGIIYESQAAVGQRTTAYANSEGIPSHADGYGLAGAVQDDNLNMGFAAGGPVPGGHGYISANTAIHVGTAAAATTGNLP